MKFKKSLFISLFFILGTIDMYGQVPGNLSFQAVIRNASNQLVISSPVGLKVSLLQGGANGTSVYSETHNVTTNSNGLVTLEIGGGTPITGDFKTVDWSRGNYFIKIEADPTGGTNYSIVTSSQILSVPYALYAKKSADVDSLQARVKKLDSLILSTQNLGRSTIIISGDDVTEVSLKEQLLREYGRITERITVLGCPNLKNLDLSIVKGFVDIDIRNNVMLEGIDLSNLDSTCYFMIDLCPLLKVLKIGSLKAIKKGTLSSFTISRTSLMSLNIDNLIKTENDIDISNNKILKSILLPNLANSKNSTITLISCDSLKSIQLDKLIDCGYLNINFCPRVDSLLLPSLVSMNRINIFSGSLSHIRLDNLTTYNSSFFIIEQGVLSSQEINYLLSKIVTFISPTLQTVRLRQRIPAPPIGQGLIDKQILINRGINVFTD